MAEREINARIELTNTSGFVAVTIDVTSDKDNPSRILAEFIGRNVNELLAVALREHERGTVQ